MDEPRYLQTAKQHLSSTAIHANFSAVQLENATIAVEAAINEDMDAQVKSSQRELEKVKRQVNDSMGSTVGDMRGNCKDGEDKIRDMLSMFDDVLSGLNIASFTDMVSCVHSFAMIIMVASLYSGLDV